MGTAEATQAVEAIQSADKLPPERWRLVDTWVDAGVCPVQGAVTEIEVREYLSIEWGFEAERATCRDCGTIFASAHHGSDYAPLVFVGEPLDVALARMADLG